MKRGFTLVELSIVLVIIGLLIGGILAAQSMINTAKVQGLVRQIGQFDTAVTNFQTKYNQLPGDTNLMGNSLGNNDGTITCGNAPSYDYFTGECEKFWSDLSKSGLMNSNGTAYVDYSNGGGMSQTNPSDALPRATLNGTTTSQNAGKPAYFFVFGNPNTAHNYYYVSASNVSSGNLNIQGYTYSPADTLAIDQKIDDGLANSGNMSGSDIYDVHGANMDNLTQYNGTCTSTAGGTIYKISGYSQGCALKIRIGISNGTIPN